MTPTISTARMVLRPLKKPSTKAIGWLRDPDVVRFSEQRHAAHTLSSQLRYVNSFTEGSHLWAIWLVASGEHIGNLSATHDGPNNVADIGVMIGEKKYWGKGLAGEAWREACLWLLNKDGGKVRKLEAGCMKSNLPMVRIIERSAFRLEGERLNHFLVDGNPISAVLYGRAR